MTTFKKQQIDAKTFAITAEVDGEEIDFIVVVGESEDEIQGLVDFYIDSIKTPPAPPVPTYAQKRAAEYPPIFDYIDGVVTGDQAQIDAYVLACLAVKAKYPKEQA
jgi:hypothetical protein